MFVDHVISVGNSFQVIIQVLLPSLKHLFLELQVSQVLSSLLACFSVAFGLPLRHLILYCLHLHAAILILDVVLDLLSHGICLTVVL